MFKWLRSKMIKTAVRADEFDDTMWIMVPFRYAEAARVSLHTIQAQKSVPPDVRNWLREWLVSYNSFMSGYMQKTYGPTIFPLLDQITRDVMPEPPTNESWDIWEKELNGDDSEKS